MPSKIKCPELFGKDHFLFSVYDTNKVDEGMPSPKNLQVDS